MASLFSKDELIQLSEIKKLLCCAHCKALVSSPYYLPCSHMICQECFISEARKRGKCPLCQMATPLNHVLKPILNDNVSGAFYQFVSALESLKDPCIGQVLCQHEKENPVASQVVLCPASPERRTPQSIQISKQPSFSLTYPSQIRFDDPPLPSLSIPDNYNSINSVPVFSPSLSISLGSPDLGCSSAKPNDHINLESKPGDICAVDAEPDWSNDSLETLGGSSVDGDNSVDPQVASLALLEATAIPWDQYSPRLSVQPALSSIHSSNCEIPASIAVDSSYSSWKLDSPLTSTNSDFRGTCDSLITKMWERADELKRRLYEPSSREKDRGISVGQEEVDTNRLQQELESREGKQTSTSGGVGMCDAVVVEFSMISSDTMKMLTECHSKGIVNMLCAYPQTGKPRRQALIMDVAERRSGTNLVRRSIKYLKALCRGLRVLDSKWLRSSLEANEAVNPSEFEVGGSVDDVFLNAPFRSRTAERDELGRSNLLADYDITLVRYSSRLIRPLEGYVNTTLSPSLSSVSVQDHLKSRKLTESELRWMIDMSGAKIISSKTLTEARNSETNNGISRNTPRIHRQNTVTGEGTWEPPQDIACTQVSPCPEGVLDFSVNANEANDTFRSTKRKKMGSNLGETIEKVELQERRHIFLHLEMNKLSKSSYGYLLCTPLDYQSHLSIRWVLDAIANHRIPNDPSKYLVYS